MANKNEYGEVFDETFDSNSTEEMMSRQRPQPTSPDFKEPRLERPLGMPEADWQKYKESMEAIQRGSTGNAIVEPPHHDVEMPAGYEDRRPEMDREFTNPLPAMEPHMPEHPTEPPRPPKPPLERPSGMPEADWQKYKESMEHMKDDHDVEFDGDLHFDEDGLFRPDGMGSGSSDFGREDPNVAVLYNHPEAMRPEMLFGKDPDFRSNEMHAEPAGMDTNLNMREGAARIGEGAAVAEKPMEKPAGMPESDWQRYKESMERQKNEPSDGLSEITEHGGESHDEISGGSGSSVDSYERDPMEKPAGMPEADWVKYKEYLEGQNKQDGISAQDAAKDAISGISGGHGRPDFPDHGIAGGVQGGLLSAVEAAQANIPNVPNPAIGAQIGHSAFEALKDHMNKEDGSKAEAAKSEASNEGPDV